MRRGRARALASWLGAFALLVQVPACGPSAERREAEEVLRAVQVLREAAPGARTGPLTALAALAPKGDASATARRACLEAYQPHQKAKDLMQEIGDAVVNDRAGDQHGALLLEAQALIAESQAKMPACEEAVQGLRRVHRL